MSKIINKIISCFIAISLFATCMFMLAGCGKTNEQSKVMNVSLNPSIEFVLDKNDKVVTVNALNDDGNAIVASFDFSGMNAENAAKKFLELANEKGFVLEGSTVGNELKVSISGDEAENLYNKVKNNISSYTTELGIQLQSLEIVTRENLEVIVAECYQELQQSQIDELSYDELIKKIEDSRQETKNLVTQELKDAYYRERAQELISAEIEAIQEYIEQNASVFVGTILNNLVNNLELAYNNLKNQYTNLQSQFEQLYYTGTQNVNSLKEQYIEAKKLYLKTVKEYNASTDVNKDDLLLQIESYKQAADTCLSELNNARSSAKQAIDNFISLNIEVIMTQIETTINGLTSFLNQTTINTKIQEAMVEFAETYSTVNESKNNNNWETVE